MADNLEKIKCPACQKEMTKIFIESAGINIDVCLDGCGGIYFDNREYKRFDEQDENIDEILKAKADKEFIEVDETLERICPICGAPMLKTYTSPKEDVQIDECYTCGGKFLDHGELLKIRAQYTTENDREKDFFKKIYFQTGISLESMEAEHQLTLKNRTPLKKLYDYLFKLN